MTVRFVPADRQTDGKGRERIVSTVYVAFAQCTEREAVRLLGLVDSNLRAILEEGAIGPPEWEPVGKKAKAGESEAPIPENARTPALVYDTVEEREDAGAFQINY